ncbi:hypothetical protein CFC21_069755 [Triticum aestivum]|uniref:DUF3615 domain-containing protein n=3 Tax=Triticum TaxID=4564 RepID=A0A9R0PVD1_TRITD|nr:uncharacterized protein LOC123082473 [Triticum aestivum]KAF7063231.1 hypothetical protein CFC21_069755 [Triticum aestivum]VAH01164.1 unnamed protein product [Triticum turgidum subsp. durum]
MEMEAPSSPSSSRVAPAPLLPPVRYYMLDEHNEEEEEWLSRLTSPGGEPPGPCLGAGWLPPPMSPRAWKAAAAAAQQPEPPQDEEEDPESEPYPYDEQTLYAPRLDPVARQRLQTSLAKSAAQDALHHYNANAGNKVKLELTRATRYVSLLNSQGSYHHIDFFATAMDQEDATSSHTTGERFFFAELHDQNRRGPGGARIRTPTCLCSLDGEADDRVGGLAGNWFAGAQPWLVPVDYCLACDDEMKHPKDGASYQAGHLYALPQPGQGKPRALI